MKLKLLVLSISMCSSLSASAMTEEECKGQAMTAVNIQEMIDDGVISPDSVYSDNLKKALRLLETGEYCKARKIVLNLNNPSS
ncbi:hypothetical protein [Vibrio sp. R78045]|uniref:hypothetical protein n=1 Tax=Vibrio sp. R78045 TaxID=3093868 RepID=UPI0036F446CB